MERYSEYKDSGVKWLGEIPSHWEMKRWRFLMNENSRKNADCKVKLQLQFRYGDIVRKNNQSEDSDVLETISKYTVVGPDDIMINGLNLNYDFISQRVAQVKEEGVITSAYISLRPTNIAKSRYYTYFLKSMDAKKMFHGMGTGIRLTLSYNELKNQFIPCPSLDEQNAIASYLDSVTSKIDRAIAQQQRMIELLNERKQIIINNAVTKGLDPNVPMKDSGVEWIGMIPEHWEVRKTLFCLSMPITDGPHETPQLYEEGIPFVSAEAVSCGNGRIDFNHIRGYISKEFYEECCKKYIPQIYDIYMIKSGATTGKVALVDTNKVFTIWSPLAVFRCNKEVMQYEYMFYMLQSDLYQLQVQLGWSYGTQQNIGMRTLEKLKVPVPPIQEQISIAKHINDKCIPIDKSIEAANKQISLLQERKQIIINDVVTGKVRVV